MFQNKLISRGAKLKPYWTVVRPIVTYACETWVLNKSKIDKLLVLRGKFLGKSVAQVKKMIASK
jgi:hypothetical protein